MKNWFITSKGYKIYIIPVSDLLTSNTNKPIIYHKFVQAPNCPNCNFEE